MDPLADVLALSRVRGALLASVRAAAPWGLDLPAAGRASFHAVTSGTAWLGVADRLPMQLMPGDLLLLPAGISHTLASAPDARCEPFDGRMKAERMSPSGDLVLAGPGPVTTLVCAGYEYDPEIARPLMGLLPDVVHVPADPVEGRDVAAILLLLAGEVDGGREGSPAAVSRLIELLLIAAIRRAAADDVPPSWLRALRDPSIAPVLGAMHDRPGHPWTLATLAREAHLSRATLSRRFGEAVGEPPLSYLTRWRMQVAAERLAHSDAAVDAIAREVGYSSPYAFTRAFARYCGKPPGRYRRLRRAAEAG